MSSLEFETEAMRPVKAWCTSSDVHVSLADGRSITVPLWWYSFLDGLEAEELNAIDLMHEGIWWDAVDEGVSVKSMLLGQKMPGAKAPRNAA